MALPIESKDSRYAGTISQTLSTTYYWDWNALDVIASLFEHPSLFTPQALEIRETCHPGYNELDAAIAFQGSDPNDSPRSVDWYIDTIRLLINLDELSDAEDLYAEAMELYDKRDKSFLVLASFSSNRAIIDTIQTLRSVVIRHKDPLSSLPPELFIHVLRFLGTDDMQTARLTSRNWSNFIKEVPPYWQSRKFGRNDEDFSYIDPSSQLARRVAQLRHAGLRMQHLELRLASSLNTALLHMLRVHTPLLESLELICPGISKPLSRFCLRGLCAWNYYRRMGELSKYLKPLSTLENLRNLVIYGLQPPETPAVTRIIHTISSLRSLEVIIGFAGEREPQDMVDSREIVQSQAEISEKTGLDRLVIRIPGRCGGYPGGAAMYEAWTSLVQRSPKLKYLDFDFHFNLECNGWSCERRLDCPNFLAHLDETHKSLTEVHLQGLAITTFRSGNIEKLNLTRYDLGVSTVTNPHNLATGHNLGTIEYIDCIVRPCPESGLLPMEMHFPWNFESLRSLKIQGCEALPQDEDEEYWYYQDPSVGEYYMSRIFDATEPPVLSMHSVFWDGCVVEFDDTFTHAVTKKFPNLVKFTFLRNSGITEKSLWILLLGCKLLECVDFIECDYVCWEEVRWIMKFGIKDMGLDVQVRYRSTFGEGNF